MLKFKKVNILKVKEDSNKTTKLCTPSNVRLSM